ncbi:hypothetical protein PoMZ_03506 [Pyricularia oryzae]|uniref:Uncharacterized protein n=1 Tax=Pyricularia oryzae TaxID=318829 RepID=A0A4P7NAX7_PYROR|nr:hypothetical protein PoMZ_03506 [Pyricularia oryzae]
MADLEGQLAQARDENAAREREIITAMLKQAKLPDRLESRSFRAEVNQIAEHWSRYGPSKSGLTFGTLICLCRSLPRTDWDLLQRHPETFREQAPSVNERLGTWKWEVWEWFRKFVNPEFQKSCIVGMVFENFKDDFPEFENQLQRIQMQTSAAEAIQLPSATFQNPSGTPVDKATQVESTESWSRKSPGTTSCNPRECNLADSVVSRAALLSQPPGYLSSVASYANNESSTCLSTDLSDFHQKGFSHWNDESTTGAVQSLAASGFWSLTGLNNIYSILANQKLRSFLDQALGPGPYIIRHCSWWSRAASDGRPIYLKQNTERNDKCLCLHILLQGTCIRYFTGSHKESWPAEGLPTFINYDQDRLQVHKQETILNGLTLFDPRINHQFENGSAMTIIFGKEETLEGWAPLLVENPHLGHVLEKMKQDLNIGWNIRQI